MSYGVLADFSSPEELVAAVKRARERGFVRVEAYTPFPVPELQEPLNATTTRVPLITLIGGLVGGIGGLFLQWYSAVIHYPLNIGGRPLFSWPAFIPVIFELTVLGASLAAGIGMLLLNGLPRLHHPLFDVHEFELASRNRFFLCIRSDDPIFESADAVVFVRSLKPRGTWEVP